MKIKDFLISSNCLHSPAGYNSIWSAIIRKKKKSKRRRKEEWNNLCSLSVDHILCFAAFIIEGLHKTIPISLKEPASQCTSAAEY